jgi:hypothetical protein
METRTCTECYGDGCPACHLSGYHHDTPEACPPIVATWAALTGAGFTPDVATLLTVTIAHTTPGEA